MLQVKGEAGKDGTWTYKLSGTIDDRAEFDEVTKTKAAAVVLDFDGVTGANSYGIRKWALMLKALKGKKVTYANCRPVLLTQINVVRMLADGVDVASFYMPFECEGCNVEVELPVTADVARDPAFQENLNDKYACKRCNRQLTFIEDEGSFFRFLAR